MIDLHSELKSTFKISKISDSQHDISITLPKNLSYFVGHFPQFPVLPSVALIDITIYLTRLLDPSLAETYLKKIKYLKIKSPLGPDQKIKIQINQESASLFNAIWQHEGAAPIAEINFVFSL